MHNCRIKFEWAIFGIFIITSFTLPNVFGDELDKSMKSAEGKPRYWAWSYGKIGGADSYDKALVLCHELVRWGATDLIWETHKGAVPWPTELSYGYTDISGAPPGNHDYNKKHDRVDALCRAAKKYNLRIWFSKHSSDSGLEMFFKHGWNDEETVKKIVEKRRKIGFYAFGNDGKLLKAGNGDKWRIRFDLAGEAYLQHLKDQLTELKNKYGHYDVVSGLVIDEFELTLLADPLSDNLDDFSEYCETTFGEKYAGDKMPQFDGINPRNVWWRREMLFRTHIMNCFLRELTQHAHTLGFEIIKPNRNLEGYNDWPWKCGMDVNAYSSICDYVWISTRDKAQLDPYLNYPNIMVGIGMAYGHIAKRFASCFHGLNLSDHAFPCGTTINHLDFYTKSERELFFGFQNNANWFQLFNHWTGGSSPAKVAIVTNSPVYAMRYPKTLDAYNQHVAPLFEQLSERIDVDGFQLPQLNCLKKYPLIVVPHAVSSALTTSQLDAYRSYVDNGGVILSLNATWKTSLPDLTGVVDETRAMTGCEVSGQTVKTILSPNVEWLKSTPSDIAVECLSVVPASTTAKALVTSETGRPVLCEYSFGKGKVVSCWIPIVSLIHSGKTEFLDLLERIVFHYVSKLPVTADGNTQIVQTVLKDNVLAVSLRHQSQNAEVENAKTAIRKLALTEEDARELGVNTSEGLQKATTKLKVDVEELEIPGRQLPGKQLGTKGLPLFSVRNVVAGRMIQSPYRDRRGVDINRYAGSWTAEELKKGIPVSLEHENEFAVIAVGEYDTLNAFHGVMPNVEWKNAASKAREGLDTPMDQDMGLKKPLDSLDGIKVGIYKPILEITKASYGVDEVHKALESAPGITPVIIEDYSPEILKRNGICVLIYCQSSFRKAPWIKRFLTKRNQELVEWVKEGGGLLAKHDVCGYRSYPALFPEVCAGGTWHTWGEEGKDAKTLEFQKTHPLSSGFEIGERYTHSYPDHVQLKKGSEGQVIVTDKLHGKPVLIVGNVERGRYVADGTLGFNPTKGELSPKEAKLLVNIVEWLARRESKGNRNTNSETGNKQ